MELGREVNNVCILKLKPKKNRKLRLQGQAKIANLGQGTNQCKYYQVFIDSLQCA